MSSGRISARDLALAGMVILIWSSNFIVVRWGLDRMAPLALCAWRFVLSFFPMCFFMPRPKCGWLLLVSFGAITGLGQFGLLFIAMRDQISPAVASVVAQTQAFFNVGLAVLFLGERIRFSQVVGCAVAAVGLVVIGAGAGTSATAAGIILVLISGLSWASANVVLKRSGYEGDIPSFIVWMSPFAALPLVVLAILTEGSAASYPARTARSRDYRGDLLAGLCEFCCGLRGLQQADPHPWLGTNCTIYPARAGRRHGAGRGPARGGVEPR